MECYIRDNICHLWWIAPLALIQISLMVAALVSVIRSKKFKRGNKVIWIIISVLINTIGPILYFTLGRAKQKGGKK